MNGKGLQYWMLGAMFTLLLLFGGFIYNDVKSEQERLVNATSRSEQRLSVMEAQYSEILRRLDRIENKLDQLTVR